MKKNLLGLILLLSLLVLGTTSYTVYAEEITDSSGQITYVNPLYNDVISEVELEVVPSVYHSTGEVEYLETIEEAGTVVRNLMKEHADTIVVNIKYAGDTSTLYQDIFNEALIHTGVPNEGDYLAFNYGGFGCSYSEKSDGTWNYVTITYEMKYYTTAEQEAELDVAIENLLAELNLYEADDYTKIKGIYEYICEHVTYDYEHLYDSSYQLQYSAYAALINGTAVCQGYSNLFYRLALELGVDNRIIAGDAYGAHTWNIVKLGDLYYNADTTWDADAAEYFYFLRSQIAFFDHIRNSKYDTEEFHAAYPMSEDDYNKPEVNPFVEVYQDGVWLGKCSSMEDAFALVTDETAEYRFWFFGPEGRFELPAGEWPKAKMLDFSCYYMAVLCLSEDAYLNSDVTFHDMSLECSIKVSDAKIKPVMHAGTHTLTFLGEVGYFGVSRYTYSSDPNCYLGFTLDGPEATLIVETSDTFEIYASDVTIGTVYMNGVETFKIYGNRFVCDTFRVAETVATEPMLMLTSVENYYYYPTIYFNVENMIVEPSDFLIDMKSMNLKNYYRVGNLQQTAENGLITLQNYSSTGREFPATITIDKLGNTKVAYDIYYIEMYYYTMDELVSRSSDAVADGNMDRYNFYFEFMSYLQETEEYYKYHTTESPDEIMTYKGTLMKIDPAELDNVSITYIIKNEFHKAGESNYTNYIVDDFLGVDADGNLSRAKDEIFVLEDGVLKKITRFTTESYTLVIPEEATSIAEEFRLDDKVERVNIHSGVRDIADYALAYNHVLGFVVDEANPYYTAEDGVLYSKAMDKLVAYPARWGAHFIIPDTVKEIAESVFSTVNMLSVTVPASVETVKSSTFQGNKCYEYTIHSANVEEQAFRENECQQITFESTVRTIGSRVLENANSIKSVYLLNPNVKLNEDTFAGIGVDLLTIYGYAGSTAEEYVHAYGEEYGLVFSVLSETTPEPQDDVTSFVSRLYVTILGREADEVGLAEWTEKLKRGIVTGVQVAEGFIMSDEFLGKEMTNEEFVQILYRALFDREADAAGLADWTSKLEQGYIKKYVFAGFANSNEFAALCMNYGIIRGELSLTMAECTPGLSDQMFAVWQFIERLYVEVLGRTPDPSGMADWSNMLFVDGWTGTQVAVDGFLVSQEFMAKAESMTNEIFVKTMYRVFFDRDADQDGLAIWTAKLTEGYSRKYIYGGFTNSSEFRNVCNRYGITCGELVLTMADNTPNLSEQEINVWNFVERLYIEVLGRPADSSGMADWSGKLLAGTMTGAQAAESVIMSQEFLNKSESLSDEEYVRIMYKAFFNRIPGETEVDSWLNALDNGMARRTVFVSFANAQEFSNLCEVYGITQGSIAE